MTRRLAISSIDGKFIRRKEKGSALPKSVFYAAVYELMWMIQVHTSCPSLNERILCYPLWVNASDFLRHVSNTAKFSDTTVFLIILLVHLEGLGR
mmetsp:Transcript_35091/g.104720  ORF Transcript_35091/g.104720 Transcript_35091/m.104720 type:complete len:95 (+) Transcript_35091:1823-2107(+)